MPCVARSACVRQERRDSAESIIQRRFAIVLTVYPAVAGPRADAPTSRPSVRLCVGPSVCPPVTLMYCERMYWVSSKVIT